MKKFIVLSSEGLTIAPNDSEINNFQVLDLCVECENKDGVLEQLLENNTWISEAGYNVENLLVYELA